MVLQNVLDDSCVSVGQKWHEACGKNQERDCKYSNFHFEIFLLNCNPERKRKENMFGSQ
jgi:hypothetical protein